MDALEELDELVGDIEAWLEGHPGHQTLDVLGKFYRLQQVLAAEPQRVDLTPHRQGLTREAAILPFQSRTRGDRPPGLTKACS